MRTLEEVMKDYNLDETKIPAYSLPDPLTAENGDKITTAFEWIRKRRPEILKLFMENEYGHIVPRPDQMRFEILSQKNDALDGTAVRREIRLHFAMNSGKEHSAVMLLYIPRNLKAPAPVFVGLNFKGNHATTPEDDVMITGVRPPFRNENTAPRFCQITRWCPKEIVSRGYASATLCYHDLYPDYQNALPYSILGMLFSEKQWSTVPDFYTPIGAWAWGLSRMLDYLETDPMIDAARAAVHGHSRLGKTSLWAGAVDRRFKMVISNDSGCAGATLHKRKFGENVEALISHDCADWFVTAFHQYSGHEERMPFDQHELLALIAPRPLAVHTATLDVTADPHGEFLSCLNANPVYQLFGAKGLPVSRMPAPDQPVTGPVSFLYRTGKHDQTPQDWAHYLHLADIFL